MQFIQKKNRSIIRPIKYNSIKKNKVVEDVKENKNETTKKSKKVTKLVNEENNNIEENL